MSFYKLITKPFTDRLVSFFLLIILLPFFLLLSLILIYHFKGFPFFSQERLGLNEKKFKIYKFRTFVVKNDFNSISEFGKFLRKTSIDELPQLINILNGDMSFVGPRPLYPSYLKYYNEKQKFRHNVLPGLTGLSQIEEGNSNNWNLRLKYDIIYVNRQSFCLDFFILFKTIFYFLSGPRKTSASVEVVRFDTDK